VELGVGLSECGLAQYPEDSEQYAIEGECLRTTTCQTASTGASYQDMEEAIGQITTIGIRVLTGSHPSRV
jgi:hypothetical protein